MDEKNEIMEMDEVMQPEEPVEEQMPTAVAMLIGAGLALGITKAVKFAKKKWSERAAKLSDGYEDADFEVIDDPDESDKVEE